jgi:hypothetical protein
VTLSFDAASEEFRCGLRQKRDRVDFLAWADQTLLSLRALKDADRVKYRELIRRDGRLWDVFFDEIVPLRAFLDSPKMLQDFSTIQMPCDGRSRDCIVEFDSGGSVNLEVTKPRHGELDRVRDDCLAQFGYAPVYFDGGVGEMRKALRENRVPKLLARDHSDLVNEQIAEVQGSINAKSLNARYEDVQPILLLVAVSDFGTVKLDEISSALMVPAVHPFREIYLVGLNSRQSRCLFEAK